MKLWSILVVFSFVLSFGSFADESDQYPWESQIAGQEIDEAEYQAFKTQALWLLENHDSVELEILDFRGRPDSFRGNIQEFQRIMLEYQKTVFFYKFYEDMRIAAYWQRLVSEIEKNQVVDFAMLFARQGKAIGEVIDLGFIMPSPFTSPYLFDEEVLRKALLAIPAKPKGAFYDGALSKYVYRDKELYKNVMIVSYHLSGWHSRFMKVFDSLPKEHQLKFQTNLQNENPESRREPFDLLQGELARQLIFSYSKGDPSRSSESINKIQISKLVQYRLAQLLGVENDLVAAGLPAFFVNKLSKSELRIDIYCGPSLNDDGLSIEVKDQANETILVRQLTNSEQFISSFSMFGDDIFDFFGEVGTFTCGSVQYDLEFFEEQLDAPISHPGGLSILSHLEEDEPLKALASVALVSELSQKSIVAASAYLQAMFGYRQITRGVIVDTKKEYQRLFKESDIVVNAGHTLDVNRLDLGSAKSKKITFQKRVRDHNGKRRKIHFTALLPIQDPKYGTDEGWQQPMVRLSLNESAKLLSERRKTRAFSPMLINASCDSDMSVMSWAKALKISAENDVADGLISSISDLRDFPHAIGSKNSFGTESISDVLANFYFPMKSMELVARGYGMPQVMDMLKQPAPRDFIVKALEFLKPITEWNCEANTGCQEEDLGWKESLRRRWERMINPDEEENVDYTFLPVYSLETDRWLKFEEVMMKLTSEDGEELFY